MNNRVDKYSLTCFLMTAEAREFTPQWKAMRIDSSIFSQVGDVNICGSSGGWFQASIELINGIVNPANDLGLSRDFI